MPCSYLWTAYVSDDTIKLRIRERRPEFCVSLTWNLTVLIQQSMATSTQPILIIGAGIAGLALAQACRKDHIPYRVFERDESPSSRGAGWGLTLVKSLPAFKSLVPEDVLERLPETYVNSEAFKSGERGNFVFFNLSTGEAKWKSPPAERIRVNRRLLRNLMLTELNLEWNKVLKKVVSDDDSVTAIFSDGTSVTGSMLVACDGAHSVVRREMHPSRYLDRFVPLNLTELLPVLSNTIVNALPHVPHV